MPKVSVIMPVYNGAKYIADAVQSVLNQTYRDFELIIVDDGSTDNTREIISSFGNSIHYVYQENRGAPAARNHGIGLASGEFIAFMDADDIFMPEKIQTMVETLDQHPELGLVYSWARVIDENGNDRFDPITQSNQGQVLKDFLLHGCLIRTLSMVVIRRSVVNTVGMLNPEFKISDDFDYYIRVANGGYAFGCIQSFLIKYRIHSGNISNKLDHIAQEEGGLLRQFFERTDLDTEIAALKPQSLGYSDLVFALRYNRMPNRDRTHFYLMRAAQNNPMLFQNLDVLRKPIINYVVFTSDTEDEAKDQLDRLFPELDTIISKKSNYRSVILGQLYATLMFRSHERKEYKNVRKYFKQTLSNDRNWLSNKGFVSTGLRNLLKSK